MISLLFACDSPCEKQVTTLIEGEIYSTRQPRSHPSRYCKDVIKTIPNIIQADTARERIRLMRKDISRTSSETHSHLSDDPCSLFPSQTSCEPPQIVPCTFCLLTVRSVLSKSSSDSPHPLVVDSRQFQQQSLKQHLLQLE